MSALIPLTIRRSVPIAKVYRLLVLSATFLATSLIPDTHASARQSAPGCETCLGRPTNDIGALPDYRVGFRRVAKPRYSHRRAEFLLISYPHIGVSDATEWPVVKALGQFGTWGDIRTWDRRCKPVPDLPRPLCTIPTFDLTTSHFRSKYVAFVHADFTDAAGRCQVDRLTAFQKSVFLKYARTPGVNFSSSHPCDYLVSGTSPHLPLILVNGYVRAGLFLLSLGDFEDNNLEVLPFDTIHDALVSGKDPVPGSPLNYHVNAEANLLTALVCQADKMQPKKVCSRKVIATILKHVR